MKEIRYFYVPNAASVGELPEEEAKHAVRVLRLQSGDRMVLVDGEGDCLTLRLVWHRASIACTTFWRLCRMSVSGVDV